MKAYIYNTDTMVVAATIEGDDQDKIIAKADELGADGEAYALTFTPAFGCVDGLVDSASADNYQV